MTLGKKGFYKKNIKKEFTKEEKQQYFKEKKEKINKIKEEKFDVLVDDTMNKLLNSNKEIFKETLNRISSLANFHNYSPYNTMLILYQGMFSKTIPSQLASFKQWKDNGYKIKEGSKGFEILVPLMRKDILNNEKENIKEKLEIEDNSGDLEYETKLSGFKVGYVFDIEQVEEMKDKDGSVLAKPFNNLTKKVNISFNETKEIIEEKFGYKIIKEPLKVSRGGYVTSGIETIYDSNGNILKEEDMSNNIYINSNLTEDSNVGSLFHELSHLELGHRKGEGLELNGSLKEIQAELLTHFILKYFDLGERDSLGYILNWFENYLDNNKFLLKEKKKEDILFENLNIVLKKFNEIKNKF